MWNLFNRTLNAFRALMSLTDEEVLEIGYVIKELRTPGPRARRDMTEAIARHQADLVYNYLSKYKVPELVRVIRGETMSPLSLLLWAPYLVVEDVQRCPRALESLLAARCSPNQLGSPARAPLSLRWRPTTKSRWKNFLHIVLTQKLRQKERSLHFAQLCAIGAEALFASCFCIGLMPTCTHCPQLLLLLKGRARLASHRWN